MKVHPILAMVALAGFILVGCNEKSAPHSGGRTAASPAPNATVQTVHLKVTGMTWQVNCPQRVQSALTSVKGVHSATVTMPDSAVVTGTAKTADLKAAVRRTGYRATVR